MKVGLLQIGVRLISYLVTMLLILTHRESLKVWILWRTMLLYFMQVILWHARSLGSGAALLWAIFCFLLPVSIKPHEVAVASREKQRDVCHGPVKGRIEQVEKEAPNFGDSRSQHLVIGTPSFEAAPCHVQQMYPVNNMVTGFISIDELKKYSGNLNDFIPGCAQYSVCRVQRERNVFSLLRSKKRNPTVIHTH